MVSLPPPDPLLLLPLLVALLWGVRSLFEWEIAFNDTLI